MWPIGWPATSVKNYHYTLRNIPDLIQFAAKAWNQAPFKHTVFWSQLSRNLSGVGNGTLWAMNGRAWAFRVALSCRRGKKKTLEALTLPSNVNLIAVMSRLSKEHLRWWGNEDRQVSSLLFIQLMHFKMLKFTLKFTWEVFLHVSVFHNHHGATICALLRL